VWYDGEGAEDASMKPPELGGSAFPAQCPETGRLTQDGKKTRR